MVRCEHCIFGDQYKDGSCKVYCKYWNMTFHVTSSCEHASERLICIQDMQGRVVKFVPETSNEVVKYER